MENNAHMSDQDTIRNVSKTRKIFKQPGTFSQAVLNVISTPLEEGLIPNFLTNISTYIEEYHILSTKHVQILLHFASSPLSLPHPQHHPLNLLTRLLALHYASTFAYLLPLPFEPFPSTPDVKERAEAARRAAEDDGFRSRKRRRTLEGNEGWEARGNVEVEVKKRVKGCLEEGVYGLLWEKRRVRSDTGEDGRGRRSVDDVAWGLVRWLLALWEKDKKEYAMEHPDASPISPLFVSQLPRKSKDLQFDDLTAPFAVLRSAYDASDQTLTAQVRIDIIQHMLDQILCLVQGPATVFHAPSLPLAFLSFFRSISPDNLADFVPHLSSTPYPATVAHIYTIYLEDLGGTRASQVRARKKGTKGMSMEEVVALGPDLAEGEEWGALAPPSIGYLLNDLLLLTPAVSLGSKSTGNSVEKKGRDEAMVRMDMVKSALLVLMLDLFEIEHEGWTEVLQLGGEWEEGVKGSMEDLQAEEILARIGILRDVLQDNSPTDDEDEEEEDTAEQHDEADEGHGGKDARAVKDFKGEGVATDGSGVKAQASASMLHLENDAGDEAEATEEIEEADEVDGTSEGSRAEDES